MQSASCCLQRQIRRRHFAAAALASGVLLTACLATTLSLLAVRLSRRSPELQPQQPPLEAKSPAVDRHRHLSAVVDHKLLLVSELAHLMYPASARTTERLHSDNRFHPSSFLRETQVLNNTVHCDPPLDSQLQVYYSEPTWLCRNVRVGKRHLPFTSVTTRSLDDLYFLRQLELADSPGLPIEMCGRLPERENNVFLLCELLLAGLLRDGADFSAARPPEASSVHVPHGNCSLPKDGRAVLVGNSIGTAAWHHEDRLWPGFIVDIYCSFPPPT